MTGGFRRWSRSRTREQWTFLLALAAAAPLCGLAALRVGPAPGSAFSPRAREAELPPAVRPDWVDDRYANYWFGANPFAVETATRMPLPELDPPERVPPPLVVPFFRPSPPASLLSGSGAAEAFDFKSDAPALPAAWMPDAATLAELAAIALPEPPAERDLRDDRDSEWDVFILKTGSRAEGQLIMQDEKEYTLQEKTTNRLRKIPVDQVESFVSRATNLEKYEAARKDLKPTDYKKHLEWGAWCRERAMVPEAIAEYEAARKAQPRETDPIDALAGLYEKAGRYEDAAELLTQAASEAKEKNADYLARAGELFERLGLYEAAHKSYVRTLKEKSTSHLRARLGKAWMEYRLGDFAACRDSVKELLADKMISPTEPLILRAAAALTEPAAEKSGPDAEVDLAARLKAAKSDLEAVAALAAQGKVDARWAAEGSNLLGVVAAYSGSPEAAKHFVAAIKDDANGAEAWTNLGLICALGGLNAEARGLFRKALDRDPGFAPAHDGMALALAREKNDEAQKWIKSAADADPSDAYPHYLRGRLAAATAPADAEAAFQAALRRAFGHGGMAYEIADFKLAQARLREGEGKRPEAQECRIAAEALYRRASLGSKSPGPALGLLGLLLSQGRLDEASDEIGRLQQRVPANDPALQYVDGVLKYLHEDELAEKRLPVVVTMNFEPAAQAGYAPAKRAIVKIEDWLSTRVVLDDAFEREPGPVGGSWTDRAREGISATVEGGQLKVSGEQGEAGLSLVEAEFEGKGFWRAEATIQVGTADFAAMGMALYFQAGAGEDMTGLHVALKSRGGEKFFVVGSASEKSAQAGNIPGTEIRTIPIPAKRFSVRIDIVTLDERRHLAAWVRVDEDPEWRPVLAGAPAANEAPTFRLALFGGGSKGRLFTFFADDVKVYEKKR